jgi:diketogulonate reductase-like aldo/keto reductase
MSQAAFIYGTAWKKDQTTGLVIKALEAGFVAIDTAAQPKNYREDLVGVALRLFCDGNRGKRETIFVSPPAEGY